MGYIISNNFRPSVIDMFQRSNLTSGGYTLHKLAFVGDKQAISKGKKTIAGVGSSNAIDYTIIRPIPPCRTATDALKWFINNWGGVESATFCLECEDGVYWRSYKQDSDPSVILTYLSDKHPELKFWHTSFQVKDKSFNSWKETLYNDPFIETINQPAYEWLGRNAIQFLLDYAELIKNARTDEKVITGEDIHWEGYFNG